jgi:hypothetical protein
VIVLLGERWSCMMYVLTSSGDTNFGWRVVLPSVEPYSGGSSTGTSVIAAVFIGVVGRASSTTTLRGAGGSAAGAPVGGSVLAVGAADGGSVELRGAVTRPGGGDGAMVSIGIVVRATRGSDGGRPPDPLFPRRGGSATSPSP